MLGDEVPGDERAEPAGAAGDEDGAVQGRGRCVPSGRGVAAGQPWGVQLAAADGELGFPGRERGGQQTVVVTVEVHQHDTVGVLGLHRADQAPHRRRGEAGDVVAGKCRDGAAGDERQPPLGEPFVGQPPLDHFQRVAHGLVRALGGVWRAGRPYDHDGGARGGVEAVGRLGPVRTGAGREGDGGPLHRVERGGRGGVGVGREPAGVDRAQGQRLDAGDRRARVVGHGDAVGVGAAGGDPDPQAGGAGGVQDDPGPGEGQPDPAGVAVGSRVQHQGVQDGVEQCGVHTEARGGLPVFLRQPHLRVQVLAVPPQGPQPLEGRSVVVAERGQPVVHAVQRLGRGALRWPDAEDGVGLGDGGLGLGLGGEGTAHVPGPGAVGAVVAGVGTGVDGERPQPRGVRGADGDLDPHGVPAGQRQRCLQREVRDPAGAEVVPGRHGEFDEGGGGYQHGRADGVVRQPRMAAQRQPTGEQRVLPAGEFHGGGQERVLRGVQAEAAGVGGRRGRQPVMGAPEGVRRQAVGGGRAGEERRRVQGGPRGVGAPEAQGQRLGLRSARAHQRHGRGSGVLQRGPGERGQHGVRSGLDEHGGALGGEFAGRVEEADGRADLVRPVLG